MRKDKAPAQAQAAVLLGLQKSTQRCGRTRPHKNAHTAPSHPKLIYKSCPCWRPSNARNGHATGSASPSSASTFLPRSTGPPCAYLPPALIVLVHPRPNPLLATDLRQLFSWGITYFPTTVRGHVHYPYLFADIFNRVSLAGRLLTPMATRCCRISANASALPPVRRCCIWTMTGR